MGLRNFLIATSFACIAFSASASASVFNIQGMTCEGIGQFVGDVSTEKRDGRTEQQQIIELHNGMKMAGPSYAKFEPALIKVIKEIYEKPWWAHYDPSFAASMSEADCQSQRN